MYNFCYIIKTIDKHNIQSKYDFIDNYRITN